MFGDRNMPDFDELIFTCGQEVLAIRTELQRVHNVMLNIRDGHQALKYWENKISVCYVDVDVDGRER